MAGILFYMPEPEAPADQTVDYYFDGYNAGVAWANNPEYMVDGVNAYANSAMFSGQTNDTQECTSNTCPGTNLGTITKVEIRASGHRAQINNVAMYLQPEFTGGSGDQHDLLSNNIPNYTFTVDWSDWMEITNDTNAPGTWTWSDVQSMDMTVYGEINDNGPGAQQRIAKIEIRVTYN